MDGYNLLTHVLPKKVNVIVNVVKIFFIDTNIG